MPTLCSEYIGYCSQRLFNMVDHVGGCACVLTSMHNTHTHTHTHTHTQHNMYKISSVNGRTAFVHAKSLYATYPSLHYVTFKVLIMIAYISVISGRSLV